MSWGYPFGSYFLSQESLVEDHLLVLPTKLAKTRFESFADWPKGPRNPSDPVDMRIGTDFSRLYTRHWACMNEKVFDHFRNEPALTSLCGFAYQGREIRLALRQTFQSRASYLPEVFDINLLDNTRRNGVLGQVVGVHLAEHFLKQVRREDFANHIEDMI